MSREAGNGRAGKHRADKVSIGFYATTAFKALLAYVVDQSGETATDIMMAGVQAKAKALGILDANGNVVQKHREAIKLIEAVFKSQKGR